MNLTALIRRFPSLKVLGGPAEALRLTGTFSLATAQVEAARQEATRAGRMFNLGNSAPITGIAPVGALPTTAAQWVIWNADPNRSYVIEELGMYLTSGTPGVGGILLAALFQTPAQSGSSAAGATVSSASSGGLVSKAIVKTGVTISTPAAPNWYAICTNVSAQTATAFPSDGGLLEHRNIQGGIIVPPGAGLGLAVVSPAGSTPLYAPFARWGEFELDLE